jgi:H+/Cl- antiporter ClcA
MAIFCLSGVLVGVIGMFYPYTLFWGEEQLQSVLDNGATDLPYLIDSNIASTDAKALTYYSVTPLQDLSTPQFLQIAIAKILAISVAVGARWPGGLVYPFFIVGAALSNCVNPFSATGTLGPVIALCLMASVDTSITRTAAGTSLILLLTIGSIQDATGGEQSALFPLIVLSAYVAVLCTWKYRFYVKNQRSRNDLHELTTFWKTYKRDFTREGEMQSLVKREKENTV